MVWHNALIQMCAREKRGGGGGGESFVMYGHCFIYDYTLFFPCKSQEQRLGHK